MRKIILAAFAAASFSAAASTAYAGPFTSPIGWGCHTCGFKNGTTLTGIADFASPDRDRLEWFGGCDEWGCGLNGLLSDGRAVEAGPAAVNAIHLPSGETIELR